MGKGSAVGVCLLSIVVVGCQGPSPSESGADVVAAHPPAAEPPWEPSTAESGSCGDFSCGFGENCTACALDCGPCRAKVELFFTEPEGDAAIALAEQRIGPLEAAILADVDAAEESIWLAIYDFTRHNLAQGLERAARRGVDVRLVTECEERTGQQGELLALLEQSGVGVRDDGSSFEGLTVGCPEAGGKMHHKFVVIDGRLVWVGSANLTATDLNYNHNHLFRFDDAALASHFALEWEELWSGSFGRNKPARSPVSVEVAGVPIDIGFSPRTSDDGESVTRQLALGVLAEAKTSIALALFALTDGPVSEQLGKRPSLLRGAVDATLAAQSSSRAGELCALGAHLVVENLPGKVHHKLAVVDADGPGAAVLGGSANWSKSGFEENDESLIVVRDGAVAARAAREIERLTDAPAHAAGACCFHAAEAYDAGSEDCDGTPCVCKNGLDDDFDGLIDQEDVGCSAPFECEK